MNSLKEFALGAIGTGASVLGTITQTNEILETISLIVTILGAIVSFIVVPVVSWAAKAKKDGKITAEELEELAETVEDGLEKTKQATKGGKGHDEKG